MKRFLISAAAIALAANLAGQAFAASPEEAVKAAYSTWDAAFNRQDAAAVAATYDADAVFLPATHNVVEGPDKVQAFFDGLFKMGVTNHKLELLKVMDRGDTVVAAARWSADGKDSAGADQDWGGIATHVFKKTGDDLKLILHTFN